VSEGGNFATTFLLKLVVRDVKGHFTWVYVVDSVLAAGSDANIVRAA
jgi:hypothetical protein